MINTFPYSLFADFYQPRTSVYVISDSQLAEYKRAQLDAEILELDRLIDGHRSSIERLEATKQQLSQDVQRISPSESPQNLPQDSDSPE